MIKKTILAVAVVGSLTGVAVAGAPAKRKPTHAPDESSVRAGKVAASKAPKRKNGARKNSLRRVSKKARGRHDPKSIGSLLVGGSQLLIRPGSVGIDLLITPEFSDVKVSRQTTGLTGTFVPIEPHYPNPQSPTYRLGEGRYFLTGKDGDRRPFSKLVDVSRATIQLPSPDSDIQ